MVTPVANSVYNSQQISYSGVPVRINSNALPWTPGLIMPADVWHIQPGLFGGVVQRPRAFPWPFTQDSLGVSYPSGLVGLLFDGTSIDDASNVNQWNYKLVPVPSAPPAGYTANNDCGTWRGGQGGSIPRDVLSLLCYAQFGRYGAYQPWLRGQSCYAIGGAILPLNYRDPKTTVSYYPRILLGNGLWDHLLGPCVQGQGFQAATSLGSQWIIEPTSILPGLQANDFGYMPVGPGCRNIQVFIEIQDSTLGPPIPTLTSCNLVLYRNSDWSTTGSHTTVVGSYPASFTPYATNVQTSLVNAAGFSVPDGVQGNVWVRLEAVGNTSGWPITIPAGGASVALSSRVDIPFPWTVASRYQGNDVIAVGGYKPGMLAAPNLRTPGVLTGTMTSFDAGVCGDDSYIIVQAYLTAGNYVLSTGAAWQQGFCAGPGGFQHDLGNWQSINANLPTTGQYVFAVIPDGGVNPMGLQIVPGGTGDWSGSGGGD